MVYQFCLLGSTIKIFKKVTITLELCHRPALGIVVSWNIYPGAMMVTCKYQKDASNGVLCHVLREIYIAGGEMKERAKDNAQ